MLLSSVWLLTTDMNDVANPCCGVSKKVFISSKKPKLIAWAFLWLLVLRGVVVITPSMLPALFGRLARRLVLRVVIFALGVSAALLRWWVTIFHGYTPTLAVLTEAMVLLTDSKLSNKSSDHVLVES